MSRCLRRGKRAHLYLGVVVLWITSLASSQAFAQGAACPSGEAAHVAIVLDESASIDSTEAAEIRAGLQDFVNDELDSGLVISFIGMSDADTDQRNDHILAQSVTSSTKSAFDAWIAGYRIRVIPGGQSGTGGEDFWASGLEEATELTTVPRIVFIVTDGSSGSKALTTSHVADLESRGSHVFVYGISTGDYWDQGNGTPLGPSLAGVLAANPVEASAPDGSDLLTTDYDGRATFVSLGDALSALSTSLRNSGVRIPETDSDCVLDSDDPDSDSDGILDIDESPGFTSDPDGDADGDNVLDYLDPDTVNCTDADGDGECEAPPAILDPDGDGIPNHRDLDSDGDGIPDANEAQPSFSYRQPRGEDLDGDGLDDAFDLTCDATPTTVAGNGALVESQSGALNPNNILGAPDGANARLNQTNEFIVVLLEDEVAVGQTITVNATSFRNTVLGIAQSVNGQDFTNAQSYTNLNAAPETFVVAGEPARYIGVAMTQDDNGLLSDGNIDIDAISYNYTIDNCAGFVAGSPVSPVDTDGDGTPDFLDTDSNDNGVLDADESGLTLAGVDANGDGIDDAINASYADPDGDINDTGADLLNTDGIGELDFREFDSDGDGIPDDSDTDDDGDGIPDTVEAATALNGGDTDGDGIPDERDLDSDNDGINDVDEAGYDDLDRDGFADGDDADNDGRVDGLSATLSNLDNDATPDFQEVDSDNDGTFDIASTALAAADGNNDGRIDDLSDGDRDGIVSLADELPALFGDDGDPDLDGIPTSLERAVETDPLLADSDGDGLCDGVIDVANVCIDGEDAAGGQNSDTDGLIDALDPDDDDDGILTSDEVTDSTALGNNDVDGAGGPNWADTDADGDGVLDGVEGRLDRNNNGIPAYLDPSESLDPDGDADGDTLLNGEEYTIGTNPNEADSDGDGVRDDVEVQDINNPRNSDLDMLIDALDPDDDNDGVATLDEDVNGDGNPANDDTDNDGTPNYLDVDDDQDGILTAAEDIDGDNNPTNDDTDNDGTPDYLDTDDDNDGVLTSAEPGDADGSGTPDRLEPCTPDADALACPTGDPDGDGTPNDTDPDPNDPCVPDANALACDSGDADGDGLNNGAEVLIGTDPQSADSDNDGLCDGTVAVANVCFAGENAAGGQNSDNDGLIDALDPDDDNDGVNTALEDIDGDNNPANDDTDNDGTPDYLDTDDDGDGVLTSAEPGDADGSGTPDRLEPCTPDADALACPTGDPDGDGTPNDTDPDPNDPCVPDADALACDTGDADGDGLTNGAERTLGTDPNGADSDGDGLCDGVVAVANVCVGGEDAAGGQDSDNDGTIDALDPDDDGDGINTALEDIDGDNDPTNDDTDNDGTPDYLDTDDDGDGVLTSNEPGDADGSGTPDRLEPCTPDADALACPSGDPDGDGTPNDTDPDPNDPCVPDANALACDSGDTDGDGIDNGTERAIGTDPGNIDSDGDGLCDGVVAVANGCIGGEDAAGGQDSDNDGDIDAIDEDDDGDGIDTADEDLDNDGDPTNDDSDGDGTPNYLDADDDGDGVDTEDEDRNNNGDPTDDDSDGDGTPNYLDTDDDGDGVSTLDEDVNANGDPRDDDTNANGTPDYLDPCDPDPNATACSMGDTDGDEVPNNMDPDPNDPCNPNPDALACPTGDTDMDGLTNLDEASIGSNPGNPDSDGDGVPDGLEVPDVMNPRDTDMDGTIDVLDADDDGDGKPTIDEDVNDNDDYFDDDSDGDGVPDFLDPDDTDGPDGDIDGDGIRNADEDRNMDGDYDNDDADGDGIPDYRDPDDDGDGILTRDEDRDMNGDPRNDDSDGDGTPNYLDKDDDGDGVSTLNEDVNANGDPRDDDTNMNGVPDYLDPCDPDDMAVACLMGDTDGDEVANNVDPDPLDPCNPNPNALACPTGDTDMDGVPNGIERMLGTDPTVGDSDGDGVPDGVEVGVDVANPLDTDMDGIIDALDTDDDGDGVLTVFEDLDGDGDPSNDDTDGDGTPDYLDVDDDGDGADTSTEQADPNGDGDPADAVDTDMDGVPDYLDPADGMIADLVIGSPADGDTVGLTVTVSGTGEPGQEVEVLVDGNVVGTATVDAQGNWSLDVTLEEGTREISATSEGQTAGPVTVTAEEGATPAQVTITSPAEGDTLTEGPNEIAGTGEPGAEIEVFINGESAGTATVDDEGNWSLGVDLPAGDVTVQATQGDESVTVSVSVEPDGGQNAISVEITSPTEGEVLETTNPTLRGKATPGAEVELAIDGEVVGTVTANAQGVWVLELMEPLEAGDHTLSATATLDDAEAVAMVAFSVSDAAVNDKEYLIVGGACAQAPAGDATPGQGWLLALLLGGLFVRRGRRMRG